MASVGGLSVQIIKASLEKQARGSHGNGQLSELGKGRRDVSPEIGKLRGIYSSLDCSRGYTEQNKMWKGGGDCFRKETKVVMGSGTVQIGDRILV